MNRKFYIMLLAVVFMVFSISGVYAKKAQEADLNIDLSMVQKTGKEVRYTPDSNVKKDSYTIYIFKQKEFEKKIKADSGTVKARIKILKREMKAEKPSDPYMQSPNGGFKNTYITAEIIKLVK